MACWNSSMLRRTCELKPELCRSDEESALEMPCRQERLPVSVVLRTFDSRNVCQLVLKGRNGLALNDMTRQGVVNVHKMEKRAAIQIRMLEALCPQTRDIPDFHGRS